MKTQYAIKVLSCLCLLSLPAMALSTPAHSEEGASATAKVERPHHKGAFSRFDTDGDGFYSKAEADAQFAKLDGDKDGKVSKEEWKSHMKEMRKEFKGKHKKGDWKKKMCAEEDKADDAADDTTKAAE